MHALMTGRLERRALLLAAVWMAGMVAAGCGGGADPGSSSAAERGRGDNPADPDATADPDSPNDPDPHRVTLCHIPPGNPANAHTITVGAPAVRAHLAHGDYLGPCHGRGDGGGGGGGGGGPCDDGGTPDPNPDGGQACRELGTACGPDLPGCCTGLMCLTGQCAPRLN